MSTESDALWLARQKAIEESIVRALESMTKAQRDKLLKLQPKPVPHDR